MKEIINDREILLEAVKKDGSALRYASEELKNDREIVLEAVKADGKYSMPVKYQTMDLH